ncbi:hypothetical protein K474DRAFT_1675940 [Panus rudis PR-1116 ss-1]|nr:hypothetical protein K474DRAFT_1675940 [Panus rudis PR-1116 ss-1]
MFCASLPCVRTPENPPKCRSQISMKISASQTPKNLGILTRPPPEAEKSRPYELAFKATEFYRCDVILAINVCQHGGKVFSVFGTASEGIFGGSLASCFKIKVQSSNNYGYIIWTTNIEHNSCPSRLKQDARQAG